MTINEIVINDIPIQPIAQKVGVLKEMFDATTYSHIPIAKDGAYLGCISENDLRCFDDGKTLCDYRYALSGFFVLKNTPLLDVLKAFANNDSNLMPVLNEETRAYLGYMELNEMLGLFKNMPFISEEGNIIVVEKGQNDFSFSELSQIIESNNGRLFGAFISNMANDIVQITLKTNVSGMNETLQTLRRYGYKILSEHRDDSFVETLKERSD